MGFLGAGLWGFIHTLSPVNYYTHGSQVTALTGTWPSTAYVMVVIAMISYAMPILRGREANPQRAQSLEMWAFWVMTISMGVMVLAPHRRRHPADLAAAHPRRWPGHGLHATQDQLRFFYWIASAAAGFLGGLLMYLGSFFVGEGEQALPASVQPPDSRPMHANARPRRAFYSCRPMPALHGDDA